VVFETRVGAWSQTFTGRQFWPLDPRPSDLCIEDIAHALAYQCRFGGACRTHYSVAEHSVRVAWHVYDMLASGGDLSVDPRVLLAALMHDAAEAYLVDLPRPLKVCEGMAVYRDAEHTLLRVIESWAGLEAGACDAPVVKRADEVLLATERRDLMAPCEMPWSLAEEPLPKIIRPWPAGEAERAFTLYFEHVRKEMGT